MATKALPSTSPIQESHVKVAPSSIAGNGLFATKDIPAGSSIVIAARPLLGELDLPRLQDTCANCFKWSNDGVTEAGEPINVSACSGCKKVRYCSKACQKQAWSRTHKSECKLLRDPELPPLPSSVRAALQLTAYMAGKNVSEEDKAAVRRLESHDASTYTQLNEIEQFEINVQAAKDIFERLSPRDPEASQIQEYVGKILRNSLTLTTPTLDPLGLAFDPLICTANHSCSPNAIVLFDSPHLLLRSLSPIKKDEEIFISYIDTTNPFTRRQSELLKRYCFTCQCEKCIQEPKLREDHLTIPQNPIDTKWIEQSISKLDPLGTPTSDPINHIGTSPQEQRLSLLQNQAFRLLETAKSQKPNEAIATLTRILRVLGDAGDKKTTPSPWPPIQQPRVSARLDLIPLLLSANEIGLAIKHLAKLYFEIDPLLYPQPFHPVRVIHTWMLIRTLVTAYQMPQDMQRPLDPEVKRLFDKQFDFSVVIWRLVREVGGLVGRSHGGGSVRDMVLGLEGEMRGNIGSRGLEMLERDPLGVWGVFRGLAREVV